MARSQPIFQLSQTHLQTLSTCPRKFQSLFLEQLALPQPSLGAESREFGVQFHQLIQQRELSLDIQPLLDDNPQLQKWFHQFKQCPPPMLDGIRLSEYSDALLFQDFMLVAVYDLLIRTPQCAQILDWKTYRRPPNAQVLIQSWQTRLYLFILAETAEYKPEQISMTYWFAESSGSDTQNHWITIPYNAQLHEQTKQTLNILLTSLSQEMDDFHQHSKAMLQAPFSSGSCISSTQQCQFLSHCHRDLDQETETLADFMNISAIAEYPFESKHDE